MSETQLVIVDGVRRLLSGTSTFVYRPLDDLSCVPEASAAIASELADIVRTELPPNVELSAGSAGCRFVDVSLHINMTDRQDSSGDPCVTWLKSIVFSEWLYSYRHGRS